MCDQKASLSNYREGISATALKYAPEMKYINRTFDMSRPWSHIVTLYVWGFSKTCRS